MVYTERAAGHHSRSVNPALDSCKVMRYTASKDQIGILPEGIQLKAIFRVLWLLWRAERKVVYPAIVRDRSACFDRGSVKQVFKNQMENESSVIGFHKAWM
jgi:hypothetical protein